MAEYSFSSKSNLIEHQNQSQPVYNNTSSSSNNNSTKKRFEKLKLKLIELFFLQLPTRTSSHTLESQLEQLQQQRAHPTLMQFIALNAIALAAAKAIDQVAKIQHN